MSPPAGPRHRETYRERLARRSAVDDPEIVMNAAARFLEVRSRSANELRRHLAGLGYRVELVDSVAGRLLAAGLLDDEAFARTWIEARDRSHPRSERVLRRELRQKGLEPGLVEAALAERTPAGETHGARYDRTAPDSDVRRSLSAEEAAAERLLQKRASALARVADPRVRAQRGYALLARNGFDPEVCRAASARLFTSQEAAAGGSPAADDRAPDEGP